MISVSIVCYFKKNVLINHFWHSNEVPELNELSLFWRKDEVVKKDITYRHIGEGSFLHPPPRSYAKMNPVYSVQEPCTQPSTTLFNFTIFQQPRTAG